MARSRELRAYVSGKPGFFLCFRGADGRRGAALFVTLGVLLVVSIFAYSMHLLTRENLRRSRRILDIVAGDLLLRGTIAEAVSGIQIAFRDRKSSAYDQLMAGSLAAGTELILEFPNSLLMAKARDWQLSCRATVSRFAPLDPQRLTRTTGGGDPIERICDVVFTAEVLVDGVSQSRREVRTVRIVHLMPGIFGKFTLFVRNVGSNPDCYNLFANSIFGGADDRVLPDRRVLPLVFKNGGELDSGEGDDPDPKSYRQRGFIFLGGGVTRLNLTAGQDVGYGEGFLLSSYEQSLKNLGYYYGDIAPFFCSRGDFRSPRHAQILSQAPGIKNTFGFGIRAVRSGFFTIDQAGMDMNEDNRLARSFPVRKTDSDPRMYSSILHLFGNLTNPCPTLVLGDVQRRFAEYACVVVEATGDSERDGIVGFLQESDYDFSLLPPLESIVPSKGKGLPEGTSIRCDPSQLDYSNLFPSASTYKRFMSKVHTEPYMRSHDSLYFLRPDKAEPEHSLFNQNGPAEIQRTFTLPFHEALLRTDPFFAEGDLEALPKDLLRGKAVFQVADMEHFKRLYLRPENGHLDLDTVVLIPGKPGETSSLPGEFIYDRGGIIILEHGNLACGNIERGDDPDQHLTLVALQGDIELDLGRGGGIVQAHLVASRGKIINRTPSRPMSLEGGIIAGQFAATTFPAGGKVVFPIISDPTHRSWGFHYRAFVDDCPKELER